jgi:type II secretory pathway pseudopilin PulG
MKYVLLNLWYRHETKIRKQSGQALVELLVAMGIAALMLPALATAVVASREGRAQQEKRLQASALLREANEAVRIVRQNNWTGVSANGTYRPTISGSSWTLTAGAETIGNFTRSIVISDAQRDAGGAIVTSGGTADPSTKRAVATVSWTTPVPDSVSNEAYLNRYVNNTTWSQTTQAEFAAGTETNVVATATSGGQLELSPTAGASITHQQSTGTFNDTGAATIVQAFSSPVKGGSLIVAAVSWDTASSTAVTCSDNQNNVYTTVTNTNDTTMVQAMAVCYAMNAAGGATTVTATFGAASVSRRLTVHEYSGIATTTAVDVSRANNALSTTATDNVTSTAGTTTTAGDLIFGAVMETDNGDITITPGTGFTQRASATSDMRTQDRIQASAGSVASTHTFSLGKRYIEHMVAFRPLATPVAWNPPNVVGVGDAAGTEDALDVFVSGNYAYLADATILRIYDISTPTAPVAMGTYTAAGNINSVYVSGNFAYIATSSTSSEFRVVNVTNKSSPVQAATVDVTGAAAGNSIYVDGTFAYLGRANSTTAGTNEFVILNITTPTAPTTSGSLNLSNAVNSIYVSGNFAYVATSITTAELTIINITNKAAPAQAGVYEASGTSIGTDVHGNGTTIYLGKANNTSGGEFFIINAANAASPTLVGTYEVGGNANGVFVSGTNAYLATSVNTQFRVVNIATPATPTLIGGSNLSLASNDIYFDGTHAFMASAHNIRELTIMQQSPSVGGGGGGFQVSGTLDSSTFDAGASAAFNYIDFTITEPASTDVRIQFAANNDNATWNYVGPDGTASTYYSADGAIRLATTGRYLRYRAFLTGPGTSTPVLSDITVNYSP